MKFKKSVLTLLITLLITSLFTCNIFSEDNFYVLQGHTNVRIYSGMTVENNGDNDVRLILLCNNSTGLSGATIRAVASDVDPISVTFNANSLGSSYYNGYYFGWKDMKYANFWGSYNGIVPMIYNVDFNSLTYEDYYNYLYSSSPQIDYGDLKISYSTKIAGNGQASLQNKDVLDWSVLSSNGYDLSSGAIELRIVPGSYTASSQSNLMSLIYTDFVIDLANAYYLDSVPINQTTYEMTWENIIGHLNDSTPAYSWLSIQATEGQWLKNGWIWQYRIMIDGEYLSEDYLTIYTATSSGVSNAENIVNNNYNITLQNTINNINYINNDNSTWYYQDIAIPDYDPSNDSPSWLSTLIEVIGNLLNKLLDLIGGAFSSITDGIVGLINGLGVDILGVFTNLFNNIFGFLGNLDFTSSEWLLPQSYSDNIEGFAGATNGILSVWFDNGLGLFILIPLLIWLLGVIL